MKKVVVERSRVKPIILTILAVLFAIFIVIPLFFGLFSSSIPAGKRVWLYKCELETKSTFFNNLYKLHSFLQSNEKGGGGKKQS